MSLEVQEIFDWVRAQDLALTGEADAREAELAMAAIRVERVTVVARAIGTALSGKEKALKAELEDVRAMRHRLNGHGGMDTMDHHQYNLLTESGDKVDMSLFNKVGVEKGYGLNFVSRVSYTLRSHYRGKTDVMEENPEPATAYESQFIINVPGLETEFLSGGLASKRGVGAGTIELVGAFLNEWYAGNPKPSESDQAS